MAHNPSAEHKLYHLAPPGYQGLAGTQGPAGSAARPNQSSLAACSGRPSIHLGLLDDTVRGNTSKALQLVQALRNDICGVCTYLLAVVGRVWRGQFQMVEADVRLDDGLLETTFTLSSTTTTTTKKGQELGIARFCKRAKMRSTTMDATCTSSLERSRRLLFPATPRRKLRNHHATLADMISIVQQE